MLRKLILSAALAIAVSVPAFAFETSYEPESENAVSYTTFDDLKSWETGFVNYALSNGDNEYWIRVAVKIKKEKVLHYCTLNIDGQDYTLYAVEPDYKHLRAGAAPFYDVNTTTKADDFRVFSSECEYFPLSQELVDKLIKAKDVRLEFNRIRRLHNHVKVPTDMLTKLQENLQLKYADFDKYWDPKNKDGSAD
mgnify:CR=1 FL=1